MYLFSKHDIYDQITNAYVALLVFTSIHIIVTIFLMCSPSHTYHVMKEAEPLPPCIPEQLRKKDTVGGYFEQPKIVRKLSQKGKAPLPMSRQGSIGGQSLGGQSMGGQAGMANYF